jgi:hypothetical protein
MNQPIRSEREHLVKLMLRYFTEPHRSFLLDRQAEFSDYSPQEVRSMLYALSLIGLIVNVNGKATRGAMYQTSRHGLAYLRIIQGN